MRYLTDFLVIGSGIAGLTYALKVAEHGKVVVLSKTKLVETNTQYAQGGIAAVTEKYDSYEKHIEDTLKAGAGLCKKEVVNLVVKEGKKRIEELINWGATFDKNTRGNFDLAKEGGHSENRIFHHKDNTGFEIQRALIERVKNHKNIKILEFHFSVDLLTQHHLGEKVTRKEGDIECYGAYVLNLKNNNIDTIIAKTTFIATGGIGEVYLTSTNPIIATGDGIAMVYRAKGLITNMEFVQFHPTSLYNPKERPSFLITEALRGAGAVLRDNRGKEFMPKYDSRGSLAPRDIVARAIDSELKNSGDNNVCLDATKISPKVLNEHFPNIVEKCKTLDIDISKDCIPVVPAAHYICGGIDVNLKSETSIKNLFAAGESTCTGLHGANRLASNSLLEAVVFSDIAAKSAISVIKNIKLEKKIPRWNYEGTSYSEEKILVTQSKTELQEIMSNYVGIVRSNLRLKRAIDRLEIIYKETEELYKKSVLVKEITELRNMINIAFLIIKMAKERKNSVGLHYTIDYPPFK
jgi:L-aspartate oxidase